MNLGSRYWRFSRRIDWLSSAFTQAADSPLDAACEDPHALARENATVLLQDQWSAFCRDLIYSSWRGGYVTTLGLSLPARTGSRTAHTALTALRATYTGRGKKGRQWEPRWFDPNEAIDAAKRLHVANLAAIAAGLGLTPSPLDELRAVRNYFAHRGRESTDRLKPYTGHPVTSGAAHDLLTRRSLGGGYRFQGWVADLDVMARAAVE